VYKCIYTQKAETQLSDVCLWFYTLRDYAKVGEGIANGHYTLSKNA